jgi:hypothetical protein
VLGGGGAGGSKTYAGARLWLKQYQSEQQRFENKEIERSMGHAIFFRRMGPQLLQVIEDFKSYKDKIGPNKWDGDANCCTFANGYKVQFAGIKDEDDYLKWYGNAYTLIVFDEATQFTKKQIVQLDTRLRCADEVLGEMLQLYLLTNPIGGETKQWLKQTYVSHGPEVRVWEETELLDGRIVRESRVYIPCNLFDNPSLIADGRYEANLRKHGDAILQALLLNDWDVDEGTWVGADWDPSVHTCYPFAIPVSWPRTKSLDYGYGRSQQTRTRSAVHWSAWDPEGNQIVYRAYSCRGLTAKELAYRIREIERHPLIYRAEKGGREIIITQNEWDEERDMSNITGPADADLWSSAGERDDGESRGEVMEKIGVGFYPSKKGKVVRGQSGEHMRNRMRSRTPDAKGSLEPGIAGIRFFLKTTESRILVDGEVVWTGPTHSIPSVPFDPTNPDVWADEDDHDLDAWGYQVLDRPGAAEREEEIPPDNVVDMWHVREPVKAGKIGW